MYILAIRNVIIIKSKLYIIVQSRAVVMCDIIVPVCACIHKHFVRSNKISCVANFIISLIVFTSYVRMLAGMVMIMISTVQHTTYRKQRKIRWAKLSHFSRFSRALQKFSHEHLQALYNGIV